LLGAALALSLLLTWPVSSSPAPRANSEAIASEKPLIIHGADIFELGSVAPERIARRNCASPPEFPSLLEDFRKSVREHRYVLRHHFAAKLHIFPGSAAHCVFLDSCSEIGRKTVPVLRTDSPGSGPRCDSRRHGANSSAVFRGQTAT
jgi:hypothetical protein